VNRILYKIARRIIRVSLITTLGHFQKSRIKYGCASFDMNYLMGGTSISVHGLGLIKELLEAKLPKY
jgi:hypothetical protein